MSNYGLLELAGGKKAYYFMDTGKVFVSSDQMDNKNLNEMELVGEKIDRKERVGGDHEYFALNFMSARTCNMGCKYCFAGEGEYEENPDKEKIMKVDTYLKAFDWVMNVNGKNISNISFFGGEPMLGFSQFKIAIEELERKCIIEKRPFPRISISTNAVLFNEEIFDFIKKYNIKVGLSVDGPKYINDFGRTSKKNSQNKKSAFDYTAAAAQKLREHNMFYTIQCTLNGEHIRNYKPGIVRKWIIDMGDLAKCDMVYVPVTTDLADLKITDYEILQSIANELVDFYIDELLKDESPYSSSLINGTFLGLLYKTYFQSCSGGDGFYLVDTDGDIFPCHIFCNDNDYKMGNIYTDKVIDENLEKEFLKNNRSHCIDCQSCIAKNVCKVWCNGLQKLYNGAEDKILIERCIFEKAVVEHGLRRIIEYKIYDKKRYDLLIRHMLDKNEEYIMRKTDGTRIGIN